jgi:energy-converting hydrogenase Eha subunit C
MLNNKKAVIEPLNLIIGLTLILSGVLFILNATNWGIFVAAIGLLIEATKHIIK